MVFKKKTKTKTKKPSPYAMPRCGEQERMPCSLQGRLHLSWMELGLKMMSNSTHPHFQQNESERGKRHQKSLFLCFLPQQRGVSIRDWFCGSSKN